MMGQRARVITFIGGGFSASATVIHLLRATTTQPLHLVMVEPAPVIGPGRAYAARSHPYILNVPAARMSLFEDEPGDFLAFARQTLGRVDGQDFLPRSLYGEYVATRLREAIEQRCDPTQVDIRHDTAVDLSRHPDGHLTVRLQSGSTLDSDQVVLATGTPAPQRLAVLAGLEGDPRCVMDPWGREPLRRLPSPVLVVGTGLTAADMVCAQLALNPGAEFHLVSRRGRLPLPQADGRPGSAGWQPALLDRELDRAQSARAVVRAVRAAAGAAADAGCDWRDVVTHVRHRLPRLWQHASVAERRRFLRHVAPSWEIHRHRLPHAIHERLEALSRTGQLTIHAGALDSVRPAGGALRVRFRPRFASVAEELVVGSVINCTSPDYRAAAAADPLTRSLLAQGLVAADPCGLGWRTGPDAQLLDAAGRAVPGLHYVGPRLRATHWEATAVAELRTHAARLAETLRRG